MRPEPKAPNSPTICPGPTSRLIGPKRVPVSPSDRENGRPGDDIVTRGNCNWLAGYRCYYRRWLDAGRVLAGENNLSIPQNSDPVGDLEDLAKAMRDVDDVESLTTEIAQAIKKNLSFRFRQCRRRFIQNQEFHVGAVKRLGNLNKLAGCNWERSNQCIRVNLHCTKHAMQETHHSLALSVATNEAPPREFITKKYVVCHCQSRNKTQISDK